METNNFNYLSHCVKSVQIRSFLWSEKGKYGPEKTPYLDTFHVVIYLFEKAINALFRWLDSFKNLSVKSIIHWQAELMKKNMSSWVIIRNTEILQCQNIMGILKSLLKIPFFSYTMLRTHNIAWLKFCSLILNIVQRGKGV